MIDPVLNPTMSEAFEILGNETRLAILFALWDASEPGIGNDGLAFSDLRERVDVSDSGRFNYHLDKLTDRFIERIDGEYALRQAGESVVKTVISEAGFEAPDIETTEIDLPCSHCDGQTAIRYTDDWLYHFCIECEGTYESQDVPNGCLSVHCLAPVACVNRTPDELYALAQFKMLQKIRQAMNGVCPMCTGPVEQSVDICEEHDAEGNCGTCGHPDRIRADFECTVCKEYAVNIPLTHCIATHPAVISFYYDHDINLERELGERTASHRLHELLDSKVELVEDEPIRIRIIISLNSDMLLVTLDDDLNVIESKNTSRSSESVGIQV